MIGVPLAAPARTDWRTPDVVLERVRRMAPIALDPCGHQDSTVAATVELRRARAEDGLEADWELLAAGGLAFVNPPYGREIGHWLMRCHVLGQLGGEAIALVPANTDTGWWHRLCAPPAADAVCFWRGRLTFVGAPAPAKFPSALVYWGARKFRFADAFADAGAIWI